MAEGELDVDAFLTEDVDCTGSVAVLFSANGEEGLDWVVGESGDRGCKAVARELWTQLANKVLGSMRAPM